MKKILQRLACVILILALASAFAGCRSSEPVSEESSRIQEPSSQPSAPEESIPEKPELPPDRVPEKGLYGKWYCSHDGMPVCLELGEDGAYKMTVGGAEKTGTWELADGDVVLDGDTDSPMAVIENERILWPGAGEAFRREEIKAWIPAPAVTENIELGMFDGYWVSWYVETNGTCLPASVAGDNSELIIDAGRVAMGGGMFGDIVVDFTFGDGVLSYENSKAKVVIAMQEDATLRCTVTGADSEMILYMMQGDIETLPVFAAQESEE